MFFSCSPCPVSFTDNKIDVYCNNYVLYNDTIYYTFTEYTCFQFSRSWKYTPFLIAYTYNRVNFIILVINIVFFAHGMWYYMVQNLFTITSQFGQMLPPTQHPPPSPKVVYTSPLWCR